MVFWKYIMTILAKHGDKGYATMIVLQEVLARDIVTGQREKVQYQSDRG